MKAIALTILIGVGIGSFQSFSQEKKITQEKKIHCGLDSFFSLISMYDTTEAIMLVSDTAIKFSTSINYKQINCNTDTTGPITITWGCDYKRDTSFYHSTNSFWIRGYVIKSYGLYTINYLDFKKNPISPDIIVWGVKDP